MTTDAARSVLDAPREPAAGRRVPRAGYRVAVLALAAFTGVAYALGSLHLFDDDVAAWDLSIFHQAVLHYSQLRAPTIPIRGPGYVALGDHFSPILVLLAPLYWVWADPRTLLLAQAFLIAVSVPVVGRFARRVTGPRTAWAITAGYALGWPLQAMAALDFHEVAFAVPLLALALDALDRGARRTLLMACLGLLLVREDMGLVVAALGVVLLWRGPGDGSGVRSRPRERSSVVTGTGLVVVGLLAFEVVTKVVVPHFAVDGSWHYWTYDRLGHDVPSVLLFVLVHPLQVLTMFVSPQVKATTLVALLVTTFPALRSPYVLVAVPLLASRFLGDRPTLWGTAFHYNAVVWPVLVIAALDGVRRWGPRWREPTLRVMATLGLVLPVLGSLVASPYTVLSLVDPVTRAINPAPASQLRAVRDLVPASTCVQAEAHLAPHLVTTNRVTLPDGRGRAPDFVLLDTRMPATTIGPSGAAYLARVEAAGFVVVAERGRVVLLRSPDYRGPSPSCRP